MKRIAIIRISGQQGLTKPVKETLKMFNLHKKNTCVVVKNTASTEGMLRKIKDFVTWGEIDESTFKELLQKRGRMPGNKAVEKVDEAFVKDFMACKKEIKDVPGLKKFFRLNPPIKGYGANGTKHAFINGGALGYRKDKINDLIRRML